MVEGVRIDAGGPHSLQERRHSLSRAPAAATPPATMVVGDAGSQKCGAVIYINRVGLIDPTDYI